MQSVKTLARLFFYNEREVDTWKILLKNMITQKALTETKKMSGWDRVQGVTIHKDCRIPSLYHGEDLAIVMERDNGSGQYSIRIMS